MRVLEKYPLPMTWSLYAGAVVPMPTLPEGLKATHGAVYEPPMNR